MLKFLITTDVHGTTRKCGNYCHKAAQRDAIGK